MALGTTLMYPYFNSPVNKSLAEDYNYDYDPKELAEYKLIRIMSIIFQSLVFVLGVVGNGIVIWVSGFRMKKTVNTVWFLNLAVADFLFTAFLPLSVAYTAMDSHWPFGRFMCKFNSTLMFFNLFASMYFLVVISVDRCISVVHPIWAQNHRSVSRASLLSLGVWVFALLLSSPYFVFRDTAPEFENESVINCFNNFAFSDDYETPEVEKLWILRHCAMIITRFLFGFVIPFSIIVSCYAIIIHRLKRNRSMSGHTGRPFKIIAAVITAFFVCWAPFYILMLIEIAYYMAPDYSQTLDHITTIGIPIATSLAFFNSCLNPLLYVFIGQDFRNNMRKSVLKMLEVAFIEDGPGKNKLHAHRKKQENKSFSESEV